MRSRNEPQHSNKGQHAPFKLRGASLTRDQKSIRSERPLVAQSGRPPERRRTRRVLVPARYVLAISASAASVRRWYP